MNKVARNFNLDLLRILACFMVVVIHVCATNWYSTNCDTFNFNVYNFFDSASRAAVPLFIMISGVFFLNKNMINTKQLYLKNILKLSIFYISWNLLYYLEDLVFLEQSFNIIDLLNKVILGHYHLWFIPMIIGLYIISPLLTRITVHSDKKLFKYFIILLGIGSLIFTIDNCGFLPKYDLIHNIISILPIKIICQYYSYFLLGYLLYNYEISFLKNRRRLLAIIYVGALTLCTIGTWYVSHINGENYETFYDYFSIFTLIEAIALFLIFKNSKFALINPHSQMITALAKNTLGIYAIHTFILFLLNHFNFITVTTFNPILSIPLISIIVFCISEIVVILMGKIKFISKYLI